MMIFGLIYARKTWKMTKFVDSNNDNMKKIIIFALSILAMTSCGTKAPEGKALFEYFTYEGQEEAYKKNPLKGSDTYYNPIMPGWHSEPSVCSNGAGDYYMAVTTGNYYPGIAIYHSKDLVNWDKVNDVLKTEDQTVPLRNSRVNEGIYAADIKYCAANDTYYVIAIDAARGAFFVKASDPEGEWSDRKRVTIITGVDPSFFFDDNGKAYIVFNDIPVDGRQEYNGHKTIRAVEFDIENDCTVGDKVVLVDKGADPASKPYWIESPHMYKYNGSYVLICEENTTRSSQSIVAFKGESPMGPFTPYSASPILTQEDVEYSGDYSIAQPSHADLIMDNDGSWFSFFNATRPNEDGFENLGREVFMLPVNWTADGYPVILEKGAKIPTVIEKKGTKRNGNAANGDFSVKDDFDSDEFGPDWMSLRGPLAECSLDEVPGNLVMDFSLEKTNSLDTPNALLRRVQHHSYTVTTRVRISPTKASDNAGILVFKDERHQYFLSVNRDGVKLTKFCAIMVMTEGQGSASRRLEDDTEVIASESLKNTDCVDLRVSTDGNTYTFEYSSKGHGWKVLADNIEAAFLSNAVTGGFTGTTVGLCALK